jgi:hypothetical protein
MGKGLNKYPPVEWFSIWGPLQSQSRPKTRYLRCSWSTAALRASVRRHRSHLRVIADRDPLATSMQNRIESRSDFPNASGRSDRSAERRWLRPRRSGRPPRRESPRVGPVPAGAFGVAPRRTDGPGPGGPGPPEPDPRPTAFQTTVPATRPPVGAMRPGRTGRPWPSDGTRPCFLPEVRRISPTIDVQDHLSGILLRSIRPKRARRPFDASVDHTEARKRGGLALGRLLCP